MAFFVVEKFQLKTNFNFNSRTHSFSHVWLIGYKVHIIENSDDIVTDVFDLIEEKELKESTDIFQFFYSGHGLYKNSAEKGLFHDGNENETTCTQKGGLGDCLIGTKGTLCEELYLSVEIAKELKDNASLCFFYDMCRQEGKVSIYLSVIIHIKNLYFRMGHNAENLSD